MLNLPIFIEMRGRPAIVVGGGVVAARRAELLVRSGAEVTVFARELSDEFFELRAKRNFRHAARDPEHKDFAGSRLCFIATEDDGLTQAARTKAKAAGALVNVADLPALSDFIMPSIVDRSPLVIAISTGGASPILGRMLKARLETLIPAAYGRLASLMSGFRTRVAEAIALADARRRFWEEVLEGPIAEAALSGNESAAGAHLMDAIARWGADEAPPRGEVYLVGAGPGDPDLLTFRALRLMQKADVVLYDRLTDEGVMNLVRREAERIYVGKRPDNHELPQEEISALLVRLAKEGKRVLRLKGGDPFMFGRGGEEIEMLAEHGVPFQVCPGVTAAIGAAAYAGIPLTHRDHAQACVFVTGHGKDGRIDLDWPALLQPRQTVAVVYGPAQSRGADARVHRARRERRLSGGDRRQRDPAQPARHRRNARDAGGEGAGRRTARAVDRHHRNRRQLARKTRLVRAGEAGLLGGTRPGRGIAAPLLPRALCVREGGHAMSAGAAACG